VRAPPACWPRSLFAELRALDGDRGAGRLLQALPEAALVRAPAGCLLDIDTQEDLRRALERAPGTGPG
jgi:molybdenum cofactor cytidylyltransferase